MSLHNTRWLPQLLHLTAKRDGGERRKADHEGRSRSHEASKATRSPRLLPAIPVPNSWVGFCAGSVAFLRRRSSSRAEEGTGYQCRDRAWLDSEPIAGNGEYILDRGRTTFVSYQTTIFWLSCACLVRMTWHRCVKGTLSFRWKFRRQHALGH